MKQLSKILMVLLATLLSILAFLMDENPFGNQGKDNNLSNDDLLESKLNYLPTQVLGDQIIEHDFYTLSYCSRHKNAEWVAYELRGARLDLPNGEKRQGFRSDPATEAAAKNTDYNKTGYDRGHLVPAHDMDFSKRAMTETFYMTNVSPQEPKFNRGIWKHLENKVRSWAKDEKRIFVVTGPLLLKRINNKARMISDGPSIPKGFFKVILDYDGAVTKGIAFMLDNKASDEPLQNFATTIDEVEKETGLDFFPDLPPKEQKKLEATINPKLWDFN